MIKTLFSIVLAGTILAFVPGEQAYEITDEIYVADLLEKLGEDMSEKKPDYSIGNVDARLGESLVRNGFSNLPGLKKAKRQSKHFVCTSCHNLEREDPVLSQPDPQKRLIYANENGLPFLQATTLHGAVNRESYYNGDYEKKYGDLVYQARKDIRESIQLCATECSQGRKLKNWEMESVLAYIWELQLTVGDLELNENERKSLEAALSNEVIKAEARKLLKTKYSLASNATAVPPPEDRVKGTGLEGDPKNGELIYELSCMHCHYQKRYSFLHLDKSKINLKHLDKKAGTFDRHSIFQVVRYGTFPKHGKKSYMPFYTQEKMSQQQLADLRAFVAARSASLQ